MRERQAPIPDATPDSQLKILMVEDSAEDAALVQRQFRKAGVACEFHVVSSLETVKAAVLSSDWDLVISDYSLPNFNGLTAIDEIRRIKAHIPVILVSGSVGEERAVEAIRAGARDYVLKDNLTRLVPAVLREIDESRLAQRKRVLEAELAESQGRMDRLSRFFPRAAVEKIATGGADDPFAWHRKHVAVVFVDIRGFASFVEISEPEVVVRLLNEYYSRVGQAVGEFEGTIGHVAGDGIMIFFNDPIELENPELVAVRTALRMRELLGEMHRHWAESDYSIDFGAGVASGFATIGLVGIEGCWDYSVIGTVANTAARLCAAAKPGEILVPQRILNRITTEIALESAGTQQLKGLHHPMTVYNVIGAKAGD